MKKQELINKLKEAEIPEDSYSLVGGIYNDRYYIEEVYGTWELYYCERGKRYNEKHFSLEEDACEYFYNIIKNIFK